ncbi:SDR family NAD(P)-dependent oxidoreductase [Candidatus Enterococcus mansonii]|nr:SDR family oxidoreductase [Enterococcus sp. 4G2_DIV0659]
MKEETVIITGGASGIGRASAIKFAEKNYNIVIVDIDETGGEQVAALIRGKGAQAIFIRANVCKKTDCENFVHKAIDTFGQVDVFINNAGVLQKMALLADIPESELEKAININFKGIFFGLQAVLKQMETQGHGRIINTASSSGMRVEHSLAAYSATKHAVVSLTKSVALEYTSKGIQCNAICPGGVQTKLLEQSLDYIENSGYVPAEFSKIRMDRYGNADEIAYVIVALADKQNGYMSGSIIPIDGGLLL